jgi:hypothetical protein
MCIASVPQQRMQGQDFVGESTAGGKRQDSCGDSRPRLSAERSSAAFWRRHDANALRAALIRVSDSRTNLLPTPGSGVRSPSPPPQQVPGLQISFILALPSPRCKPDTPLPHRHHSRWNDVPKVQRNQVSRHEINLFQHMHQPLSRRHMARIRTPLRPPDRRFHLHPVHQPVLLHHQVIRSRVSPRLRDSKALLHRPRQEPDLGPLSPLLGSRKLSSSLSHRTPRLQKHKRRNPVPSEDGVAPSALF